MHVRTGAHTIAMQFRHILLRIHGTGVHIEVGVNLDRGDVHAVSRRIAGSKGVMVGDISSGPWS